MKNKQTGFFLSITLAMSFAMVLTSCSEGDDVMEYLTRSDTARTDSESESGGITFNLESDEMTEDVETIVLY